MPTCLPMIGAICSKEVRNKFWKVGVRTIHDLLRIGGDDDGRKLLCKLTGISQSDMTAYVTAADLARIPQVGPRRIALLQAAAVKTVRELRHRNPDSLLRTLRQTNKSANIVEQMPKSVADWIKSAEMLPIEIKWR